MLAKYIFPVLAAVLLLAAFWRMARRGWRLDIASRTWLMMGLIFGAVSGLLWWLTGWLTAGTVIKW